MKDRTRTIARIGALIVGVIALLIAGRFLPLADWVADITQWTRGLGPGGAVVYGVIYVVAVLAMAPGSIFTMGAGFLYGPWWGTVLASIASTIGATIAFLLGRGVARERVEQAIEDRPRLGQLSDAVEERGMWMVALIRLSPLFPFNLINYAFGLTSVRLRDYVLASWVAMLPGTFMYVYVGSLFDDAAKLASGEADLGVARWAMLGLGLVATVAVTVWIGRLATRSLEKDEDVET